MDSEAYNDMLKPYGLNTPPSPIADTTISIMQGDPVTIVRDIYNFDNQPCTPDNCNIVFMIVDKRFETEQIYRADWAKGVTRLANGKIAIEVPTSETRYFRRGALLYSITVYDKLKARRQVREEGTIMIEYSADAPYPSVPYNSSNLPEDSHV